MKFDPSPGMVVFTLGFVGLVFSLADASGEIGSKVPLALFFLFIIIVGAAVDIKMKDKSSDTFGEMENGGFG